MERACIHGINDLKDVRLPSFSLIILSSHKIIMQMSLTFHTFIFLCFGTGSNRTLYEEAAEVESMEEVGMAVGTAMVTASHLLSVFPFPFTWLQQGVSSMVFLGEVVRMFFLFMKPSW